MTTEHNPEASPVEPAPHVPVDLADQAVPVQPDLPGKSVRDIVVPILTGLAGAAVFLICYFIGEVALLVLITAALGFAALEFFSSLSRVGYHPAVFLGLVSVVGLPLGVYWRGIEAYPMLLGIIVFFTFLWYLLIANDKPAVPNIGATLLCVFYIGVLGSVGALLLTYEDGENLVLAAAIATVSYDVGGWVIGKVIGRTQFTLVSPNKTLEGLLGGMILAILVPVVLLQALDLEPWGAAPGTLSDVLLLGIVAALVAPLGDLNESLLKRNLNTKDMGTLLPGHGGILDRIDALLFVMPASYMLGRILQVIEIP